MIVSYFNLQRSCFRDGPGVRTNLFLKGCPLECVWCHNPEGQASHNELIFRREKCVGCGRCLGICGARRGESALEFDRALCVSCGRCAEVCAFGACELCGKTDDTSRLFELMLRDRKYYERSGGGVTISGGEPLAQPEALIDLAKRSRDAGVSFAIETSGYGDAEVLFELLSLGCLFLYDIKGIDSSRHEANTGVSNEIILSNLSSIASRGANIILRLPMIPGLNDTERDLDLLASFLAEYKDRVRRAEIMPYHRIGAGKAESIGKDAAALTSIPDGRAFADDWLRRLEVSGVPIFVNK